MNYEFEFIPLEEPTVVRNISNTQLRPNSQHSIFLRGVKELVYTFNGKSKCFPFKKISPQALKNLRHNQKKLEEISNKKSAVLVLKKDGEYFVTIVPKNLSMTHQEVDKHLCSNCARCYASSDAKGGCAKVRDLWPASYSKVGTTFEERMDRAIAIDKYPFIHFGIEKISTENASAFVVWDCEHFVKDSENKPGRLQGVELLRAKYALNAHINPDLSWNSFLASHRFAFAKANERPSKE